MPAARRCSHSACSAPVSAANTCATATCRTCGPRTDRAIRCWCSWVIPMSCRAGRRRSGPRRHSRRRSAMASCTGAADMKSGVAAMTIALERFVIEHPRHRGSVALLLTSDEEGPTNLDGVRRVAQHFRETGQRIDWCVVGEPSSKERLGDLIRVGRRGSLSGTLTVRGVQGHVAYPEKALNPIHALAPALAELVATSWDDGNEDFPPTSFQISNLNAGTGALNVIPGSLVAHFNFRFGTASRAEDLRDRTEAILKKHRVDYSIEWNLSGEPFLSPANGKL